MKKTYMEPRMIVEDFTVSEMVAAKCDFNLNNFFTSQMTGNSAFPGCQEAAENASHDNHLGQSFQMISDAYEGALDVDGADGDADWKTGAEYGMTFFNETFKEGDNCQNDGMNMTFLSYIHKPGYVTDPTYIVSCAADSGSNPLQNS